ncbi:Uu.00g115060.m01.CDS01 [Anthostomella pinea]|uniref:Uu.00g115060.m01.CDS01 n=1 Tax=Anthostomella pinea TaxID=933095 RepID=A0AAI8YGU7_9PEZI|nr:Uu.00g115060.m01.CDS01 [Anthostomella pinea]
MRNMTDAITLDRDSILSPSEIFTMLPHRRALTSICVVATLLYTYWLRYATSDGLHGGPSHHFRADKAVNSTLNFSKIFVINLPARTDRRDALAGAATASNLSLTWVDGLTGTDVEDIGVRNSGARGSWRSHMNAVQAIVDENLGSALIMEDDVDWDVRLKGQLWDFAAASRTWLVASKSQGNSQEGRHEPRSELLGPVPPALRGKRDGDDPVREEVERTTIAPNAALPPSGTSQNVYGDGWDVLWLGHCGTHLPGNTTQISPLKVAILNDETVPAPQHLKPHPFALRDKLTDAYPPHTRVIHAAEGNMCSLGYAVSQQGARKMLRRFGKDFVYQWDLMLRDWCQGEYNTTLIKGKDGKGTEDEEPVCITVQPPLISHHYAEGGSSDILSQGGGFAKGTGSPYIRLSVRQNLRRLVMGLPEREMVDQLPDDLKPIW